MRVSRFFIDKPLFLNQQINLPAALVHYIVNVLRLKTGEDIILFNGRDHKAKEEQSSNDGSHSGEFKARLTQVTKRAVSVEVIQFIKKNIESPLKIHLFQGISRTERMDFTIQKAVELGVHSITPVFTQRSNSGKLSGQRLEKKLLHWQGVALSACEQSGRSQPVKINKPIQSGQIGEFSADINLLLTPNAHSNLNELQPAKPESVNIFIGPEGGLTDAEIELASKKQYQKIQLGPRILRTETAGLATVSILQFIWGDLK
jgi:16S rRNA (uracil1498-N3)-methyltransferase